MSDVLHAKKNTIDEVRGFASATARSRPTFAISLPSIANWDVRDGI